MKYLLFLHLLLTSISTQLWAQDVNAYSPLKDSLVAENQRATAFFEQSKYGEAIELADKIRQSAKDNDFHSVEARSCSILGNSYYFVNKDSLSFHYLHKSRDISLKNNDTIGLINIYNNLGVNFRDFDSIEKARDHFKYAVELANKTSHREGLIYPVTNLANLAINYDENFKYGIENLKDVLKIIAEYSGEYKDRKLVGEIYYALYTSYNEIGDNKNRDFYFKKCEDFAKRHNYISVLADLYYDRSFIDRDEKDFKEAFEYIESYTHLQDSIHQMKEYEKAKQIEADNFLRENREKLLLVQKEKQFHEASTAKANTYNILLGLFSIGLLLSLYFAYKSNKRLNFAKQRAENLSKVKSDFYSEISHELRTPLYAVIEISRFLLKENLNGRQREYIESLNFSGNHLLTLVNNVLELNKVESGKFKLQDLKFKPKDLINNIIESLEFALTDNGNKIHVNYDNRIPKSLTGDSLKLSQVFINLISNAIKFTTNGNIYVTAKLIEEKEDVVKLFFEVKDDGLGVSKEKQVKIFEDFYQENSKVDISYKGTGLGLSIVKRIIHAMGSNINLESDIGKGTAFNFELELSKVETEIIENEVDHKDIHKELKGKKILVVDDNRINQLVTKKIIDQFNMVAKSVDSGIKAIEAAKEEKFDCILMDLHMPQLDGYQTTSRIRIFDKETPILALTAASVEEVKSKIDPNEMNGYIMKPFITEDFIETIYESIFSNKSGIAKNRTA